MNYRHKKRAVALVMLVIVTIIIYVSQKEESLRSLADDRNILVGSAVNSQLLGHDKTYSEIASEEFNIITTENEMKMGFIHPKENEYNFGPADQIVGFAKANHQKIRGHNLIWPERLPGWLQNGTYSKDEMKILMKNHIQTVVSRYKGKVYAWDVVNEAYDDNGNQVDSILLKTIGPEYIGLAFQWAHEADPNALLFYNDDDIEGFNQHSQSVYNLVRELKQNDIPIHGVGFQMHKNLSEKLNYKSISQNINRYKKLGVQVHITEMDVNIDTNGKFVQDSLSDQAEMYSKIMKTCLNAKDTCTAFVTWGFTDQYTWLSPSHSKPLIYDKNYNKKPAYDALFRALKN